MVPWWVPVRKILRQKKQLYINENFNALSDHYHVYDIHYTVTMGKRLDPLENCKTHLNPWVLSLCVPNFPWAIFDFIIDQAFQKWQ